MNKNLRNILSLFSMDLSLKFIGFLAVAYLARVLGKEGFGVINIGLAVLNYVQILGNSGLSLLGTRKIASGYEQTGSLTGDILTLRFYLTLFAVLLTVLIANFFITSDDIRIIIIIYVLYGFPAALLLDWFFIGLQKMGITSIGRIAGVFIYLVVLFLIVKTPEDTVNTAAAWLIGGAVNAVFILYFYKKLGYKITLGITRIKNLFSLLKEAFPIGLASLISQAAIMFPPIFLGIISDVTKVGIYSAAFKLISFILVFDRVFITVFFPKITQSVSYTPEKLNEIFGRVIKIITVFAVSVAIPVVIAGELLIFLVFGSDYNDSALIFQMLMAFFVLSIINSVLSYTLIALNREKVYTSALFWSLTAFIISTIIFYPYFLIHGIVFALIIYEIIQAAIMIIRLKENVHVNFLLIALPLVVSLVILYIILNTGFPLVIKILIGIAAGFPLIAITGRLKLDDIKFIKRLLT